MNIFQQNFAREEVKQLPCFNDPTPVRNSWRKWQEGSSAAAMWIGVISFGLLATDWVKMRYSLFGFLAAGSAYAYSDRADGIATEGDRLLESIEACKGTGLAEKIGNQGTGLRGRINALCTHAGSSASRRAWNWCCRRDSSEPVQGGIRELIGANKKSWTDFCGHLNALLDQLREAGDAYYRGSVLRAVERMIDVAESLANSPGDAELGELFVETKLELAWLLRFQHKANASLQAHHPWTGQKGRAIEIFRANFAGLAAT